MATGHNGKMGKIVKYVPVAPRHVSVGFVTYYDAENTPEMLKLCAKASVWVFGNVQKYAQGSARAPKGAPSRKWVYKQ